MQPFLDRMATFSSALRLRWQQIPIIRTRSSFSRPSGTWLLFTTQPSTGVLGYFHADLSKLGFSRGEFGQQAKPLQKAIAPQRR